VYIILYGANAQGSSHCIFRLSLKTRKHNNANTLNTYVLRSEHYVIPKHVCTMLLTYSMCGVNYSWSLVSLPCHLVQYVQD